MLSEGADSCSRLRGRTVDSDLEISLKKENVGDTEVIEGNASPASPLFRRPRVLVPHGLHESITDAVLKAG